MVQITAHFDGTNLRPDQPVVLPEGVPLRVMIDVPTSAPPPAGQNPGQLFDDLQREVGRIEGPPDWAAQHDHYLYGAAKKADG